MADITIETRVTVDKDGFKDSIETGLIEVTQAGVGGGNPGTVTIGLSEETVTFGELTSAGVLWMKNLDDTNYVDWGFSTGVYGGRIKAGMVAGPFELKPATSLYMIANTAACLVHIKAYEA